MSSDSTKPRCAINSPSGMDEICRPTIGSPSFCHSRLMPGSRSESSPRNRLGAFRRRRLENACCRKHAVHARSTQSSRIGRGGNAAPPANSHRSGQVLVATTSSYARQFFGERHQSSSGIFAASELAQHRARVTHGLDTSPVPPALVRIIAAPSPAPQRSQVCATTYDAL